MSEEELGNATEMSNATCTIKISYFESSAAAANTFLPTSFTRLIVEKAFSVVKVFQRSFQSKKSMSSPLKVKKEISKTTSRLILAIS